VFQLLLVMTSQSTFHNVFPQLPSCICLLSLLYPPSYDHFTPCLVFLYIIMIYMYEALLCILQSCIWITLWNHSHIDLCNISSVKFFLIQFHVICKFLESSESSYSDMYLLIEFVLFFTGNNMKMYCVPPRKQMLFNLLPSGYMEQELNISDELCLPYLSYLFTLFNICLLKSHRKGMECKLNI